MVDEQYRELSGAEALSIRSQLDVAMQAARGPSVFYEIGETIYIVTSPFDQAETFNVEQFLSTLERDAHIEPVAELRVLLAAHDPHDTITPRTAIVFDKPEFMKMLTELDRLGFGIGNANLISKGHHSFTIKSAMANAWAAVGVDADDIPTVFDDES